MSTSVEFTEEFRTWWDGLSVRHQNAVGRAVSLLIRDGVTLSFPHSSGVHQSRHRRMRELRVTTRSAIRVFYAFDPRRTAILLIAGYKHHDRFYDYYVQRADVLYDRHLLQLQREGLLPRPTRGGPTR